MSTVYKAYKGQKQLNRCKENELNVVKVESCIYWQYLMAVHL